MSYYTCVMHKSRVLASQQCMPKSSCGSKRWVTSLQEEIKLDGTCQFIHRENKEGAGRGGKKRGRWIVLVGVAHSNTWLGQLALAGRACKISALQTKTIDPRLTHVRPRFPLAIQCRPCMAHTHTETGNTQPFTCQWEFQYGDKNTAEREEWPGDLL